MQRATARRNRARAYFAATKCGRHVGGTARTVLFVETSSHSTFLVGMYLVHDPLSSVVSFHN